MFNRAGFLHRFFIGFILLGGAEMATAELKDPLAPVDAAPATPLAAQQADSVLPTVRAIITGRVAAVAVVNNQPVHEGDTLGELTVIRISSEAVYFKDADNKHHRVEPAKPFSIQKPDEQVRF